MSPTPSAHSAESEPGQLLTELERRQDDVLQQLDDLEAKLRQVLGDHGVTPEQEFELE